MALWTSALLVLHIRLPIPPSSVPYSDAGAAVRNLSDPGLHSTSLSPQTVSSGGDSGVDSYCDHMADLPSITISLCGGLADNREITKGRVLTEETLTLCW